MDGHRHTDGLGLTYRYPPRSDAHSKELAHLIWVDLLVSCPALRDAHQAGLLVMKVNYPHVWPGSEKKKTIDMAVGTPGEGDRLQEVFISCELKAVMTEHGKSQPRLYDELASSHEIVHRADARAIAAGLTVVNIAADFVSPLRQRAGLPLQVSAHQQPRVTSRMVAHLRQLPMRNSTADRGFDAYCNLVVDCDNRSAAALWTKPPAPQPGDRDHYDSFVQDVCRAYTSCYA